MEIVFAVMALVALFLLWAVVPAFIKKWHDDNKDKPDDSG